MGAKRPKSLVYINIKNLTDSYSNYFVHLNSFQEEGGGEDIFKNLFYKT